jgi:hypothetical protein
MDGLHFIEDGATDRMTTPSTATLSAGLTSTLSALTMDSAVDPVGVLTGELMATLAVIRALGGRSR